MPTYDYECDACGHTWELFQKITDDPVKKCPQCNKKKARRLFGTGAAVVFKGSGFYQTDYRSESYKKGAKADKKSNSDSKSGSDDKSSGKAKKGASDGSGTSGKSKKSDK
ncbi:MAG: zinc ribbon domain-containing protein [Mariniblastus sp.]|nr:zinc ribbon domain-containing protein [Mariniblastus sp.]